METALTTTHTRKRPKLNEPPPITDIISGHTVTFGLTILPNEIWDEIFALVLVNPSSIAYCDLRRKGVAGSTIIPLMLVCKAWYERARFIFYAKNHFDFDTLSHFTVSLKHMALESRQNLRSIEVQWGYEGDIAHDRISQTLRQCSSLQIFRVVFLHNSIGVLQAGPDMAHSKPYKGFKDMRGLKEFTIRCDESVRIPGALWSAFVLGTEPTTVKEPQCLCCNRLQALLEKCVFQPRQER